MVLSLHLAYQRLTAEPGHAGRGVWAAGPRPAAGGRGISAATRTCEPRRPERRRRTENRGSACTNPLRSRRGTDPASGHEAGNQGSFPWEHREAADGSQSSKSALSSLHLQQQEILLIFFALTPTLISLQTARSLSEESGPARSISQSGDGGSPLESRVRTRGLQKSRHRSIVRLAAALLHPHRADTAFKAKFSSVSTTSCRGSWRWEHRSRSGTPQPGVSQQGDTAELVGSCRGRGGTARAALPGHLVGHSQESNHGALKPENTAMVPHLQKCWRDSSPATAPGPGPSPPAQGPALLFIRAAKTWLDPTDPCG